MSKRDYRILIGASGWQYPSWSNEVFYPDDLPEDWYLSFYANEFPIVLVPESQWDNSASIKAFVEEINEQATAGFQCLLESTWQEGNNIYQRICGLASINSFISGLLLSVEIEQLESLALSAEFIRLTAVVDICIDLKGADTVDVSKQVITFCDKHNISLCWEGDGMVVVPNASRLWVARCNCEGEQNATMQQLKVLIAEQLKREVQTRKHVIIVDGSPPKIEAIRNAMVMLDLM